MDRPNWVYIMTNKRNGTLYVGSTSNLLARVNQHRNGLVEGFTKKYGLKLLIWFAKVPDMQSAVSTEHKIKKWRRQWKLDLIEEMNPDWRDLWDDLTGH